ncbi:MAG: hypothetical protein NC418_07760 [Muribaculaceae bacterium]|nr:hypothetical protein [Muribaculaceae bacterium]
MKKLFLLSLAAASSMSMFAQDYVNSINDKFREGYHLSVEWANLDEVGNANIRYGIGSNDFFYLQDYVGNTVKVYNELGLEKTMTPPSDFLWCSNNADIAGNIVVRGSSEVWPGTGAYGGCFYPGKAANLIWIIDGETQEWVPGTFNLTQGPSARWDYFGHVMYDTKSEFWQLLATPDGGTTGLLTDFFLDGETHECTGAESVAIQLDPVFKDTAAKKTVTQGTAQYYGTPDEYGQYPYAAVYANPYTGITGYNPANDLGNGVRRYEYVEDEEGLLKWAATDDYFITPQHNDIGGFMVFNLKGKDYIVYPAGNYATHAADAIAIAEVAYTDTPVGDNAKDVAQLVARSYGQALENGSPAYLTATFVNCLNVQPVEGDPCSVYIYCYSSKGPMVKFKFTVPEGDSGIDNITVDNNENAPVEYYNVNGMRVENPAAGQLYIRKQGTSVAKVLL